VRCKAGGDGRTTTYRSTTWVTKTVIVQPVSFEGTSTTLSLKIRSIPEFLPNGEEISADFENVEVVFRY
jgi:hypothetical protein